MASVNARPLRNTLTQQAEARHDGHQQEKEKERSERFALDRIDAPLKKSIDSGLIGVRELLRRVRDSVFGCRRARFHSTAGDHTLLGNTHDTKRLISRICPAILSSHAGTDVRVVLLGR